jgi:acyl-CoA synthetase (NDP forming)
MVLSRALSRPISAKTAKLATLQARWLSLHEYQAYKLLRKYDVPVPRGQVAETPEQVEAIARELGKHLTSNASTQHAHILQAENVFSKPKSSKMAERRAASIAVSKEGFNT